MILKVKRPLLAFYSNRFLRQFGVGFLSIFGIIFIFELFDNSVLPVILMFCISYGLYGLIVPLTARLHGKVRSSHLMVLGTILYMFSFLPLIFLQATPFLLVISYGVLTGLFRAFFWLPYQITMAEMTDSKNRGHQMAFLHIASSLIAAVPPLIAGYLIASHGYTLLFIISLIIFSFSIFPLFKIKDKKEEHFDFHYKECFKKLFKKENKKLLIAHSANGAKFIAGSVFWPLFLYLVFSGEYTKIGLVTAAALILASALRYITGLLLDNKKYKHKILTISSKIVAFGWILRALTMTPVEILISDIFYKLSNGVNTLSFDKVYYDHTHEEVGHADEYIVLKTISVNMGRIIMLVLGYFVMVLIGVKYVFILSAIVSLFVNRLQKENKV